MNKKVFNLKYYEGENQITERQYNVILGLTLLWGFGINALICKYCSDFFLSMNPIALTVGYFISVIIGVLVVNCARNSILSFVGYNFIVLPVGAILSIALVEYSPGLILKAMIATAIVTSAMVVLSTIYPECFAGLGRTLLIFLFVSIVAELLLLLFGVELQLMDWVVVIIFCLYVGYDWYKANTYSLTANNAIYAAVDLYLDIINIFIRIVSILGRSKSKN